MVIDSETEYRKILNFTETFMPSILNAVELYDGDEPIFDAYGIEMEVQRALGKKVWLKSSLIQSAPYSTINRLRVW